MGPRRTEPRLDRSVTLNFVGDWGMANFHRICSWLTQQFCDRAGPESRVAIWNIRNGGIEAVVEVFTGEKQLAIATPAQLMSTALTGEGIFAPYGPMPTLRALAVLPQNDRMILAIDSKYGISTFEELRRKKPALRIATSRNDGTNFIGYIAFAYMKAHGITEETLLSWGGKFVTATRPEQAFELVVNGEADALLQEAIMTPWWEEVVERRKFIPLPAEEDALDRFMSEQAGAATPHKEPVPQGFWKSLSRPLPGLDFSDFVVLVREDLPEDIAYLLTWSLVETREMIERQYRHLPPEKSPLSYPLQPRNMARTPLPLHPGAKHYFTEAGYL
ncbi:hypothetical protein BGW36DRAFT_425147 [Talaromyces proteolyticus]|uniref:Uncharacterized protein n=1 Tax=Talaromyces proteolyticus TaxID=1131652 RepID=A0AAD4KSX1_9EURO|nr:uncharacterized protein BGW36DRAFT_425147 [Talaromyces proteolyticus]KAH8700317.1 hypothetical protein BGW36DRAFT_425147 [Talaromyces proteolyticus]